MCLNVEQPDVVAEPCSRPACVVPYTGSWVAVLEPCSATECGMPGTQKRWYRCSTGINADCDPSSEWQRTAADSGSGSDSGADRELHGPAGQRFDRLTDHIRLSLPMLLFLRSFLVPLDSPSHRSRCGLRGCCVSRRLPDARDSLRQLGAERRLPPAGGTVGPGGSGRRMQTALCKLGSIHSRHVQGRRVHSRPGRRTLSASAVGA